MQFVQSRAIVAVADPEPPLLLDIVAVFERVLPQVAGEVLLIT